MGQIFRFKDLLTNPKKFFPGPGPKCLVDTNYLIGLSVPGHAFFSQAVQIFKVLADEQVSVYSNVNTRAEFLDVYRRILLTKSLLDLENQLSAILLSRSAQNLLAELRGLVQEKQEISGLLSKLETAIAEKKLPDEANDLFGEIFKRFEFQRDEGSALFVLSDPKIKMIRSSFPPKTASGKTGWIEFCRVALNGEVEGAWQRLRDATQITFVEVKENEVNGIVPDPLTWENLTALIEQTGNSSYDSMIVNFFRSSVVPVMISGDADVAFAVRFSLPDNKIVIVPDRLYSDLKQNGYSQR